MAIRLDHLVIAADSLQQGVGWLSERLGVEIPRGGEHPRMATHNRVMQIGEGIFLEILAIDPDAVAPGRPRWFGLDEPTIRAAIRQKPGLLTWAVNTDDIRTLLKDSDFDYGHPEVMSRAHLQWLISIRQDGSLPAGGAIPAILQWQTDSHPALSMVNLGVRLESLIIYYDCPEWLEKRLKFIGAENLVSIRQATENSGAGLRAVFQTKSGLVEIS